MPSTYRIPVTLARALTAAAAAAVFAAAALFACAAAHAETLVLDTHGPPGAQAAGPVTTAAPLTDGRRYVVTVRGTFSIWPTYGWTAPGTICGAAEAAPLLAGPEFVNGPVGMDAQTVFAVPPTADYDGFVCRPSEMPFYQAARVQFDLGDGFRGLVPAGGPYAVPRADHTCAYEVTGRGAPLSVVPAPRTAEHEPNPLS